MHNGTDKWRLLQVSKAVTCSTDIISEKPFNAELTYNPASCSRCDRVRACKAVKAGRTVEPVGVVTPARWWYRVAAV